MILGHIRNLELERGLLPRALQTGLDYLATAGLAGMAPGKHEIDGEDIYVSVSEYVTDRRDNKKPEAHASYVDIQFMISGAENIGFGVLTAGLAVREDRLAERDVIFYEAVPDESDIRLSEGMYVIFFPWDVHRPGCAADGPAAVRKAVVKVRASLLR